jgi:preprotein translocase subunit SecG
MEEKKDGGCFMANVIFGGMLGLVVLILSCGVAGLMASTDGSSHMSMSQGGSGNFIAAVTLVCLAGILLLLFIKIMSNGSEDHQPSATDQTREKDWQPGTGWPYDDMSDIPSSGMRDKDQRSAFQGSFETGGKTYGFNREETTHGSYRQGRGRKERTGPPPPPPPPPPKMQWNIHQQAASRTPKIDAAFESFVKEMEDRQADRTTIEREGAWRFHPDRHKGEPQYTEMMKRVNQYASTKPKKGR